MFEKIHVVGPYNDLREGIPIHFRLRGQIYTVGIMSFVKCNTIFGTKTGCLCSCNSA